MFITIIKRDSSDIKSVNSYRIFITEVEIRQARGFDVFPNTFNIIQLRAIRWRWRLEGKKLTDKAARISPGIVTNFRDRQYKFSLSLVINS